VSSLTRDASVRVALRDESLVLVPVDLFDSHEDDDER
jgi:hypothetical protein